MKKTISFLSLLFGLFVCVTAFSACGGDDEPSSGGNSGSGSSDTPQTSKHVSKIITEEGTLYGFGLNQNGQLVQGHGHRHLSCQIRRRQLVGRDFLP